MAMPAQAWPYSLPIRSCAPEQFVQFAVDVHVVALVTGRDNLVGPGQESCGGVAGGLELSLAEGRRQRDVQHLAVGVFAGPHLHVTLTGRALQADSQQVTRKDPLDRLVSPDVESHADRVRVLGTVVEA